MNDIYICELPKKMQYEIARRLGTAGIEGDDFAKAMDSRVCDLSDTIEADILNLYQIDCYGINMDRSFGTEYSADNEGEVLKWLTCEYENELTWVSEISIEQVGFTIECEDYYF